MHAKTKPKRRAATTFRSCYAPEETESFVRSKPARRHAAAGVVVASRYILDRKLGEGGMGSVWLAYDQALQGFCALKVLHEGLALDDEQRIRFRREATVAARVRSENVVGILEHGEWEGQPYIAMEYVEGEDLGSRLSRTGKLDVHETYQLLLQLARGLDRAHVRGIVHRDIKPANVLLTFDNGDQLAKLVDFGVAKEPTHSRTGSLTQAGTFLGTPDYASPEQLRGRDVDGRSDLWSLAVVTFECLTGRLPFDDDSLAGSCAKILRGPLPSLCDSEPSLPASLDAWWRRAIARDPNHRYQSAKELADGFAEAAGYASGSVPSSNPQPEITGAHAEPRTPSRNRSGPRWTGWVALASVCLLFSVGLLLLKAWPSTGSALTPDGGWVPRASGLSRAITSAVVLMPTAADGLLHDMRQSAADVTALSASEVPRGIQLRCDVLDAGATNPLGALEPTSIR